jgi:serine protease Do
MGERVFSVGCPVNLFGTVFPGIINGPPRRVKEQTYWQVNMEIHPGSSGSPVFDVQGNLVGIVKGRYRGTNSIGFLIPLETIITFVKKP